MEKMLRMDESIFEMVSRHPEVVEIMVELGFKDIAKPGMLQTAGRFMTLSKGIKLKKMDLDTVKLAFERHGFGIMK
jgi:selenophosphate synthetase-related protein